jgi:hypothetical protein
MVARHLAWREDLRRRLEAAPGTVGFPERAMRPAARRARGNAPPASRSPRRAGSRTRGRTRRPRPARKRG